MQQASSSRASLLRWGRYKLNQLRLIWLYHQQKLELLGNREACCRHGCYCRFLCVLGRPEAHTNLKPSKELVRHLSYSSALNVHIQVTNNCKWRDLRKNKRKFFWFKSQTCAVHCRRIPACPVVWLLLKTHQWCKKHDLNQPLHHPANGPGNFRPALKVPRKKETHSYGYEQCADSIHHKEGDLPSRVTDKILNCFGLPFATQ